MAHLAVLVVAIIAVVYKVLGNRKIIDKEKSSNVYEFPKNTTKMHLAGREGSEGGGGTDNHHEIKNPISTNRIIWLN